MGWPDNCNFLPSIVGSKSGQNKKPTVVDGGLMNARGERTSRPFINWLISVTLSGFSLKFSSWCYTEQVHGDVAFVHAAPPHDSKIPFKNSWIINLSRRNQSKMNCQPCEKWLSNSPYSGKLLSACWRFRSSFLNGHWQRATGCITATRFFTATKLIVIEISCKKNPFIASSFCSWKSSRFWFSVEFSWTRVMLTLTLGTENGRSHFLSVSC